MLFSLSWIFGKEKKKAEKGGRVWTLGFFFAELHERDHPLISLKSISRFFSGVLPAKSFRILQKMSKPLTLFDGFCKTTGRAFHWQKNTQRFEVYPRVIWPEPAQRSGKLSRQTSSSSTWHLDHGPWASIDDELPPLSFSLSLSLSLSLSFVLLLDDRQLQRRSQMTAFPAMPTAALLVNGRYANLKSFLLTMEFNFAGLTVQGCRTRGGWGGWGGSGRPTFHLFFFFCRFSQAKKKNKNYWRDDTLITQRVSLSKGFMIAFIAIVLCLSAAAMPWLLGSPPSPYAHQPFVPKARYTHKCRDMYRCTPAVKARKRSWNRLIVHRVNAQRANL